MEPIETKTQAGLTSHIYYDQCAGNPFKEFDQLGTLICFGRSANLGSDHSYSSPKELHEDIGEKALFLPVFMYEHSGQTVNTTGFSCPWDSGQVGEIYVTFAAIKSEYGEVTPETVEKARKILVAEIETLAQWLEGNVYGLSIEDEEGNVVDSFWGYYGPLSHSREEAQALLDCLIQERRENSQQKNL